MLKSRFLFVIAGLGVAMFCMTGRHVGGSAAPGIVAGPHADTIIPDVPIPVPTSWQLRDALPARRMKFDPDAPIVDVPAKAAETPPGAGDLDPTIDVQITQEIIDKAAELGSAEAMYEFVRNECAFQPYFGSQKGSVETLHQRAGNDYDLASLLIALLRASGIPARYAVGMVEMETAEVTDWLAVDDGTVAGSILFTHGMEAIILIDGGGNVVAVRARRVWVEAFVSSGFGSPTWVPLDPAFLMKSVHEGLDIPEEMGLDALAFIDDYWDPSDPKVILPRPETPVELLKEDIADYLDANFPGSTLEDVVRTSEIIPQHLGLLPNSLPYTVRSRDAQYSEIPADRRYQIRFHLYDGGTGLIDHTVNLPEIAGKRVTIDYEGATSGDQDILDANGGIYQTPPSAVDLRPVLRIDGQVAAVGTAGVGMGLLHSSDIHFLAPTNGMGLPGNVVPAIFNVITTGASQAIGLAVEGAAENLLIAPPADDTEGTLSLLHETAVDYMAGVRNAELDVGRLMHDFVTTGVTSAILENVVKVTYSAGVPQTFDWAGLRVDADRSILGVWPVEEFVPSSAEPKDFLVITGAEGSMREHHIFEESYSQISVSTIKILELAVDAEITVYTRWNTLPLPANTQPASVRAALENAIASGNEVTFPADPMTVGEAATGQWSGTGWISMNPANGAAGYIISGNNNGGATVEFWPPEFIDLQEGDRDVTNVEIEIINPANDSPDPPAVFTRDNEEHLEFEYLVHVDYDDGSSATLGPYKRTTHNTTKTFVPGNYVFNVWIARSGWWGLLAHAHRDVSIVGVLIREDDGSDAGKKPPKFVGITPGAACTKTLKALVIPEMAPNGSPLASAYAWSGGDKLSFGAANAQVTEVSPNGSDPSTAVDDQDVDVEVTLPGGKIAHGFAKFVFAQGGTDEEHKMTVIKFELTEITGLRSNTVGNFSQEPNPHQPGRLFMDTEDAETVTISEDVQRVKVTVEVQPSTLDEDKLKVRWELRDPDDPAAHADLDGNGATGGDNTGTAHEGVAHWFMEADHTISDQQDSAAVDQTTVIGEAKTELSVVGGVLKSTVFLHYSDDGGDNFNLKAVLMEDNDDTCEDDSGMLTVWRARFLDVYAMVKPNDDVQAIPVGQGQPNQTCVDTGANGLCQTAAGGDDTQIVPVGNGFSQQVGVLPGPNGVLDTAAGGDDLSVIIFILTGANGICESAASGDDVQVIPVGNGLAGAPAVDTGADGLSQSAVAGDDAQVIAVGNGAPMVPCITSGANGQSDTLVLAGDDARAGQNVHTGPDGIAQTAANTGGNSFDPGATLALYRSTYASAAADRLPYIDWYVTDQEFNTTYRANLTREGVRDYMHSDTTFGGHIDHFYSLLGVNAILAIAGNASYPNHCGVAVGTLKKVVPAQLPKTNIHEIGHLMIGKFEGAGNFHTSHTAAQGCGYRQGLHATPICSRHCNMLRDRVSRDFGAGHSYGAITNDSSNTR